MINNAKILHGMIETEKKKKMATNKLINQEGKGVNHKAQGRKLVSKTCSYKGSLAS